MVLSKQRVNVRRVSLAAMQLAVTFYSRIHSSQSFGLTKLKMLGKVHEFDFEQSAFVFYNLLHQFNVYAIRLSLAS